MFCVDWSTFVFVLNVSIYDIIFIDDIYKILIDWNTINQIQPLVTLDISFDVKV